MIRRRDTRSWRHASYAVLDFETTGLDLRRDHVVSYGLVPVEQGRVRLHGALYGLVRPPTPPTGESIRVHGITPSSLEAAPPLEDVSAELVAGLRRRFPVAHAAGVELAFLRSVYRPVSPSRPRAAIDVVELAEALATREGLEPVASARLAALAERFGVPVVRTHHAFGDALLTAQLFVVLATRLERAGAGTVDDLRRLGRSQIA